MEIIRELPLKAPWTSTSLITIGNFDGMHLGHQAVIKKLKEISLQKNYPCVVISFENHPMEVLRPDISICKICTTDHKIQLLENLGVDILILLPFTQALSEQSAEKFLQNLQRIIPFSHLVLGWDATLGKNKQGNKEIVQEIAKKNQFDVEYLDQKKVDGIPVSSSKIREYIQEGKLSETHKLLGRTYSIYSTVYKGEGRGKKLGFPTANFNVKGLCLPPLGVYAVTALIDKIPYKGVANLGIAPTLRHDKIPLLEVHIFDCEKNLYNKPVEVIFSSFLRPEKKFACQDELIMQIQNDISKAKNERN